MTQMSTEPIAWPPSASHRVKKPASAKVRPARILAVVDGSERTDHVLNYLLEHYSKNATVVIVLLNVQPAPQEWRLRGYGWFTRKEIRDRLINDIGRRVVASAGRQLEGAGIRHEQRVELGDPMAVNLRCAQEEKCDLIVLPESQPGFFRRWLTRQPDPSRTCW